MAERNVNRPQIPAEIRRAVLVEAGHRCAIPRCGQTELDIHHIVPWETCQKHEYENLIALCPNCHRRVHLGDIDRKSLQHYKSKLIDDLGRGELREFGAPIIEIKRRITESDGRVPGFSFSFDFPDFEDPRERIVSKNLEAWGNELLVGLREHQESYVPVEDFPLGEIPSRIRGEYEIVRRDSKLISIKYTIDQYFTGAAHGRRGTRVQNFLLKPFQPVTLTELLRSPESLVNLSDLIRTHLLSDEGRDKKWVIEGTEPNEENFKYFNIEEYGLRFTFPEYQIDCYAAGEQELWISCHELKDIIKESVLAQIMVQD